MFAHQIMTRKVLSVAPDSTILDAANIMLQHCVSGLPHHKRPASAFVKIRMVDASTRSPVTGRDPAARSR